MENAVIAVAGRTPIGGFGGTLGNIPASSLGAIVIRALLAQSGLKPEQIEEVIGLGEGASQVVQHMAQVGAGLRLGRVRPEAERDLLPRLRRVPMDQEVGEEGLRPC